MCENARELANYKRNLPHIQNDGDTIFVTFSTRRRFVLPESVRGFVVESCLREHGTRARMHAVVVMPDHVHLIATPLADSERCTFAVPDIMASIKGGSAHAINRALGRTGRVWEPESFDRVLRSDENARQKAEYICANPGRAGLVGSEDEYAWLWREWVEGSES